MKIKNLTTLLLALLVLIGCGENSISSSIPENIVLSCSCIESESTDNQCTYSTVREVIVNFETNSMRFMEKNYENLGTTPTSFSVRDKSSFVVLNRGNLRLTFDWNRFREIYQCYENKI